VAAAHERYEAALAANDVAVPNEIFTTYGTDMGTVNTMFGRESGLISVTAKALRCRRRRA
jgi:hypothetical protein